MGFGGDGGPATLASLNFGEGHLTVDSAGAVLFADSQNGRIRKIGPNGVISTVAGNGFSGNGGDGGPATLSLELR
jgi:sugar lactone lactonase YvrE